LHTKYKKQKKMPSFQIIVFICLVFVIAGYLSAAKPSIQEEEFGICAECHEDVCADFKLLRHGEIKSGLWTDMAQEQETLCANCHGDTTQHIEEGGGPDTIFSFKETDLAQAKTEKCLNCHSGTRADFFASPHGKAAMDCTNCHDQLMKGSPIPKNPTEVCTSCHEDVFSEFQLNERHRLQEGILGCTDCHDQHAPSARERLGGFKNESCFKCHADKEGPYLYEHDASRVEGCSACHDAHGNPNRHMLTMHSVADLCFSCHGAAPSWHERFDSYSTNCTTCHSTIHGSNLSKIFLK
jgi:DmsE family decaheme c-type cytochrome